MPAFILVPDNPYLQSPLYESTFKKSSPGAIATGPLVVTGHPPSFSTPYHAAEVVDPLLDEVVAAKWTTVITDNNLFRRLLRLYFLFLHSGLFIFNKDYFLQDMAAGRTDFWCPLLVNAVLAVACVRLSPITTNIS